MDLREAIRTIIREVAEDDLRRLIREVLVEELVAENPRRTAAKKAVITRAANKELANLKTQVKGVSASHSAIPKRAKFFGVFRGQQYRGKKSHKEVKHRFIEVVRLDERGIYPKILGSAGKNAKAKRISYETLLKNYDRVI